MRKLTFLGSVIGGLLTTITARAEGSWNNPPKQQVAGLDHRTFRSASMKADVGYNICLPPEYRDEKKRFPVIYYLHGYKGNESSYLEYASFWRQSLSRSGPTILVFANGGETSFFCDSPDGLVMGETVVKELISHIDQTCRTMAQRPARSLHGYSMGGFGALKLAFKYPDLFGSVVAYGATLGSAQEMEKHLGKVYAKMFGGDKARFEANNPLALAEQNAERIRRSTRVLLTIGTKDEFLPANRQLHRRLTTLGVDVAFEEIRGARHKKEAIYESAALPGFAFTAKTLPQQ